jgi:hypothetical protein
LILEVAVNRSSTRALLLGSTVLVVSLAGCYEEPVKENLDVEVLPQAQVALRTSVVLNAGDESNRPLVERIDALRGALANETDVWSRRYQSLDAKDDRFTIERKNGKVVRVERQALVGDLRLPYFFADTSINVSLNRMPDGGELTITSQNAGRATAAQKAEFDRELARFSESYSRYVASVNELYRYLDTHPDRARALLLPLFSDALPEAEKNQLEDPPDEEKQIVSNVSDSMSAIASVLVPNESEPYTPNELSRLVFDPFPGDISVTVPGEVEHVEGFERKGERRVAVRRIALWDIGSDLSGRWVSPDLLAPWVAMKQGEKIDLDAIVRAQRKSGDAPGPDQVRKLVLAQLQPAPVYRVRWRTARR